MLTLSCEEQGGVVSDVSSLGFDSPKVNPPLGELPSVLDVALPNTGPPLAPNLKAGSEAGWSDFLSSLQEVPNLKPPEEVPNLNPDEAAASFEDVSDEEFPNWTPNLNPTDGEDEEEDGKVPNLKLADADPDPDVVSDVPNLKPPKVEEEFEVEDPDVAPDKVPKDELKAEKTE